jgi:transcriptional regulator with XRE-family HTH domain
MRTPYNISLDINQLSKSENYPNSFLRHWKDEEKMAFSKRLHEICEEMELPVLNKGLQQELARIFNVRYQSTQKWLDGTGYPVKDKAQRIASWAGVTFDWLMTGALPKKSNQQGVVLSNLPENKQQLIEKIIQFDDKDIMMLDRIAELIASEYKQKFDVPPLLASSTHLHADGAFFD